MKKQQIYKNGLPLEMIFVLIGFIFGLLIIFENPPFHSADEIQHFNKSFLISEFKFFPSNPQKLWGSNIPKSIIEYDQLIKNQIAKKEKIGNTSFAQALKNPLNSNVRVFNRWTLMSITPIPYIPFALGIVIGRIVDDNPFWLVRFGRMGGLIFFLILGYYIIKITPIFKGGFFIYLLTPIVLFQGASVTYDTPNNIFAFLLIALFLRYALDDTRQLLRKDIIVLFSIILLFRLSKGGYPLIPFLFFLIPISKMGGKRNAIIYGLIILFIYFIPDILWNPIIKNYGYTTMAGGQRDVKFDGVTNLKFILANPFEFTIIFLKNLQMQSLLWLKGTMGRFGHSYLLHPDWFFILQGFVLIFVSFFESDKKYILNKYQKSLLAIVAIGTWIIIIIGDFVLGTPVGGNVIFGLQGRYFVPIVIPILLLLYGNYYYYPKWHSNRWLILGSYAILELGYTVWLINNYFWGL